MTANTWETGSVALIRVGTGDWEYAVRREDGLWACQHDTQTDRTVQVQPVVVIDPESMSQVARLAKVMMSHGCRAEVDLQSALRAYVTPPKPSEPMGRYAVVVANGVTWCRAAWASNRPWSKIGTDVWAEWSDMDVTSVESEGVTA